MTVNQQPGKIYRRRVSDQILEDLRGQILSGALPHGTKLPSERELAARYGVSGPTVREAIRVLTAMGLVASRNGSGSTVTAQSATLMAVSIASVVQFEKMGARDVFGLLSILNGYAVRLAAERASAEELTLLRRAGERAIVMDSVQQAAGELKDYFLTLSAISHHPLLAALCRSITEIQIGLAVELSGGSLDSWRRVAGALHKTRIDIVEALEDRDADRAVELVQAYHQRIIERIQSSPRAKEITASDPGLSQVLSAWLGTNVSLGNDPGH
jgi:DNA-binding FadR family transcriptional regulator